ncbi:hypothetical protein [Serratia proteamaculans]
MKLAVTFITSLLLVSNCIAGSLSCSTPGTDLVTTTIEYSFFVNIEEDFKRYGYLTICVQKTSTDFSFVSWPSTLKTTTGRVFGTNPHIELGACGADYYNTALTWDIVKPVSSETELPEPIKLTWQHNTSTLTSSTRPVITTSPLGERYTAYQHDNITQTNFKESNVTTPSSAVFDVLQGEVSEHTIPLSYTGDPIRLDMRIRETQEDGIHMTFANGADTVSLKNNETSVGLRIDATAVPSAGTFSRIIDATINCL